jgi:alkylhydroperoxidase/carboxymuconolactone decarboxylase family protein YurZ
MAEDALWYEAAQVVGITNALNVVADGLGGVMAPVKAGGAPPEVEAVFAEIRRFFPSAGGVPEPFTLAAHDPGYLADLWAAARRAYGDNRLSRRLKAALAFAVSLTTRSRFGTPFHLAQMRRLGVGERGVLEIVGVTQMFSSYSKIADTLQLESDMGDMAPADPSPAPGADSR